MSTRDRSSRNDRREDVHEDRRKRRSSTASATITEEEAEAKRALAEAAADEAADREAAAGSAAAFAAASIDACATLSTAMMGGFSKAALGSVPAPYIEEEEEEMPGPPGTDPPESFLGDLGGVLGLLPEPENME